MSKQAKQAKPSKPGKSGKSGKSGKNGTTGRSQPGAERASPPTPHRPVVFIALVLFIPVGILVIDGNLSVQTALIRFIAALVVSWVAARFILNITGAFAQTATPAKTAAQAARPGGGPGDGGLPERRAAPRADPGSPTSSAARGADGDS